MGFLDKMERELLNEAFEKQDIDTKFVVKLMGYLDSLFPDYGTFSQNINTELKKYVKVGAGLQQDEITSTREQLFPL